jgi:hypothetical protein
MWLCQPTQGFRKYALSHFDSQTTLCVLGLLCENLLAGVVIAAMLSKLVTMATYLADDNDSLHFKGFRVCWQDNLPGVWFFALRPQQLIVEVTF